MKFLYIDKLISMALILLILLTGCNKTDTTETEITADALIATPTITITPTATSSPTPTPTFPYIVREEGITKSSDPTLYVQASPSTYTLDPAQFYGDLIENVYETLVFYDQEKLDVVIPLLAESWVVSPDGKTWTFHIRNGVKFHNGDMLKASDVAYSFQRALSHGGDYIQWVFSEPFFGIGKTDVAWLIDPSGELVGEREKIKLADPETLISVCENIKSMVEADDEKNTVTIHLKQEWAPFLEILAIPSLSILDAGWIGENGGWDGSCESWQNFYGLEVLSGSPFDTIENGTGPFIAAKWARGRERILLRFDDYWGGPANFAKIEIKSDWEPNKLASMMKSGVADNVYVDEDNRNLILELVGVRCEYDPLAEIYKPCQVIDEDKPLIHFADRPANEQYIMRFNFNIPGGYGNPFIGSGKLDGKGIPGDFFSDIHTRQAIAYCFDYDSFISYLYNDRAIRSTQLLPSGVIGYDPELSHYVLDLEKCESEFKLADLDHDGIPAGEDTDDLWQTGFYFKTPYYESFGFKAYASFSKALAKNINSVNSKFVIEPSVWTWEGMSDAWSSNQIPVYGGYMSEVIHDPYYWFQPLTVADTDFMTLPDELVEQFRGILDRGLAEKDPIKRSDIYKEASQLYYNQAVGVPLAVPLYDYFWQRWVHGQVLNPYLPDTYFYPLYKE